MAQPVNGDHVTRPIVVCGAQKSCSTSFAAALCDHDDVMLQSVECLALERPRTMTGRQVGRKSKLLASRSMSLCVKRPEYLHLPALGKRAAEVFCDAVAVVVLREPMSRFHSAFHHYRRLGLIDDPSPAAYLYRWMNGADPHSEGLRRQPGDFSFYAESLEQLIEAFGGRVEAFYQEEVLDSPHTCLSAVWLAAELPPPTTRVASLPNLNAGAPSCVPNAWARAGARLGFAESRFGSAVPRRRPLSDLGAAMIKRGSSENTGTMPPDARAQRSAEQYEAMLVRDHERVAALVGRPVPQQWTRRPD